MISLLGDFLKELFFCFNISLMNVFALIICLWRHLLLVMPERNSYVIIISITFLYLLRVFKMNDTLIYSKDPDITASIILSELYLRFGDLAFLQYCVFYLSIYIHIHIFLQPVLLWTPHSVRLRISLGVLETRKTATENINCGFFVVCI